MGLQFEALVLDSQESLFKGLGLGQRAVLNAGPYAQGKTRRQEACQIDFLVRARESLYVVELKCRRTVGVEVIDEVRKKVEKLKLPKGQSGRTVLVHTGKLEPVVEESDYFDAIINADKWIE
jgi:hypothetical protein